MMINVELEDGERVDDLQLNNLYIIQNKNLYAFTCDAVLLANFAKSKKRDNIVDLCSGSGIVGILTLAKNNSKSLTCVEIQECMANMCKKTVMMNEQTDLIDVVNCSVQNAPSVLGKEKFDVVVCNPPYKKTDAHKISEKPEIAMAKYEVNLTFKELAKSASSLLRFGGKFFFVHETNRLSEIFEELIKVNLQPKRVRFVYPKDKANSHIVLVEAVKGAKVGLIVEPPQILN